MTETLYALLGAYAQHAPAALFVADKHGRQPETEIARLKGARFVVGSEIEEGAKFAESRIKDLTGQDTLTGRFLYGSSFDFKPTHKLWIFGNHKPDVSGNDFGIWRRMRLVPFEVQIPAEEVDRNLPNKLLSELPGILNWMIAGCLRWQTEGKLIAPLSIQTATDEYRDQEDELGEFIDEKCIVGEHLRVSRGDLYLTYLDWVRSRGIKLPLKQKSLAKRLRCRDGIKDGKSGERYWRGVGLKDQRNDAVTYHSNGAVHVSFPPSVYR